MASARRGRLALALVFVGLPFLLSACASGRPNLPPSVMGTHTVMGRALFPGGVMVLVEAHLNEGDASGRLEYSQVQSRREISLRVFVDVACVGIFKDGTQAVVAGPVDRADGDYEGMIGPRDWWFVTIEDDGAEGDRILSSRADRGRALGLCQAGPDQAATLEAIDGDLSIL